MIGFILSTYVVHGILCDKNISTYSYQTLREHSRSAILYNFTVLGANIYSLSSITTQTFLLKKTCTIPQVYEHM